MLCVLLLLLLRGANPVWFFFLCDITFASVFSKFSHCYFFHLVSFFIFYPLCFLVVLLLPLCCYFASDHISGSPIHDCPAGRPDASSANVRCNGSGRRGCIRPRQRCTPRWWPMPDSLGIRCRGP